NVMEIQFYINELSIAAGSSWNDTARKNFISQAKKEFILQGDPNGERPGLHSLAEQFLSELKSSETKKLQMLKQQVCNILNNYICSWKCSLFGHHHNQRMAAVISAINTCDKKEKIDLIIQNQLALFSHQEAKPLDQSLLAPRWSLQRNVVNRAKENYQSSDYYRKLQEASRVLEAKPPELKLNL
ncbi:MAG: hypothetical protein ACYCQI_16590, partial [Gammaproteobacteria bacterium]